MTMYKALLRILVAPVSVVLLTGATPGRSEENGSQIAKAGDLRVAIQTFNPALATRRSDGQYTGVGVDVATALGKALG